MCELFCCVCARCMYWHSDVDALSWTRNRRRQTAHLTAVSREAVLAQLAHAIERVAPTSDQDVWVCSSPAQTLHTAFVYRHVDARVACKY
jgi:hypothetical protein